MCLGRNLLRQMGAHFLEVWWTHVSPTRHDDKTSAVIKGSCALTNETFNLEHSLRVRYCPRQFINSWEGQAQLSDIISILIIALSSIAALVLSGFRSELCHLPVRRFNLWEHQFPYLQRWTLKCPSLRVLFRMSEDNLRTLLQCLVQERSQYILVSFAFTSN